MSREIVSTWLKLTDKNRSREFSHSLGEQATFTDASRVLVLNVPNREAIRRFPANSGRSR